MAALLDGAISADFRIRDVSRTFTLARAEENPFTTLVAKGPKPKSSLYEWPFKTRFAPSDNSVADAQDVETSEIINNEGNKFMLQGRTQKGRVVIGVDDVAEELGNEYALEKSLVADNVLDAIILARENTEFTNLKNGDSSPYTSTPSVVHRKMRGITSFIRSANPGSPDLPVPSGALTPAGNIKAGLAVTAVTEEHFLDVIESISTTCRQSKSLHVYASPGLRRKISRWTKTQPEVAGEVPVRQFNHDVKTKEIMLTVERISCDFGKFFLHTHFSLPAGVHALIIDMSMVKMRPVRVPSMRPLEYRGGAHLRMIEYINGLEVCNPQAHGKITT
jgi:hypothetical protein